MSSNLPTSGELHTLCRHIDRACRLKGLRPWCDCQPADGAQLLYDISSRNLYEGRWQRLLDTGQLSAAHRSWRRYVQHTSRFVSRYHDQVSALERREPSAWRSLAEHLQHFIYNRLLQYGIDAARARQDCEDLAQTACEKLLGVLDKYPWDVDFPAWLRVVAANLTHDLTLRSRETLDRGRHYDFEDFTEHSECSEARPRLTMRYLARLATGDHALDLLVDDALATILAALPTAGQREVFFWRRICGWDIDEVAAATNRTHSATASIQMRAERNVRRLLAECPEMLRF